MFRLLLSRTLRTRIPVVRTYRITPTVYRPFSLSFPRYEKGEVDSDLLHQIEEEIELETEDQKTPSFIQDFLSQSPFKLDDQLGYDEVSLSRTFANEKIKVSFSISDIKQLEEERIKRESSFPVRATISIRKEGKGTLVLELTALDGSLDIHTVRYFREGEIDPEQITSQNIREKRQDLYMGPDYDSLDEDFQTTFIAYLEERGIDTALASFLPDYIDYKERKEYVNWLRQLDGFVSA
ncbi:mitochondrial glycoprotein [Pilobolus umbonatus]|nr:mitochondrial glycoprotein [Pilobolus umbonatus]